MEEENIFLSVRVCVCTWVSLPYQSVSTVLIGQKIFPLMCLGMGSGEEGRERERGGGRQLSLSLRALKRTSIYQRFQEWGGVRSVQVVRSHTRRKEVARIIKIATASSSQHT